MADLDLLSDLVARAKAAGADAADALAYDSASVSVTWRLGGLERLERAESADIGLRVLIGKRQAIVSSSDRSKAALDALVERAVAMARVVPEDPYCGLADPSELARTIPDLDTVDVSEPSAESLIADARAAEESALAVDGITNSEGGDAGWARTGIAVVASNGFYGAYAVSRHSLSVSVIAGQGTGMQRDYDYHTAVYGAERRSAESIGRRAAEKAIRRLNPIKLETGRLPIVIESELAGGMLGSLSGAINGASIARGTSFLKDSLGKPVFGPGISIIEDPFRLRSLRARPFDGEGIAPERRAIIENGVLTTWLLDLRSARQLGLRSTGHASRGTSGPPSPSPANWALQPGPESVEALLAPIERGIYVTALMGQGVNLVTGDYSRGATGFLIENGRLGPPVAEITVAGNLADMFRSLTPADDLVYRSGIDSPTLRIDGMMVAGQ